MCLNDVYLVGAKTLCKIAQGVHVFPTVVVDPKNVMMQVLLRMQKVPTLLFLLLEYHYPLMSKILAVPRMHGYMHLLLCQSKKTLSHTFTHAQQQKKPKEHQQLYIKKKLKLVLPTSIKIQTLGI